MPLGFGMEAEAAGTPLLAAVEELCRLAPGETLEAMEQRTLGEIFMIACRVYGNELTEFWRVWEDWHSHGTQQPMGDL